MIRAFAAAQGHHASTHLRVYASWLVGHLRGVGRQPSKLEGHPTSGWTQQRVRVLSDSPTRRTDSEFMHFCRRQNEPNSHLIISIFRNYDDSHTQPDSTVLSR